MADCTDFPTPEDAKRFKNNAGSVDEFVTSDSDTFVDQDGGEHITIEGIDTLAETQRDQFDATFQAQFTYKRIGNISDYVGNSLPETDKLNSYQFPDNSGDWYGPLQNQSFPIAIPADPTSDNKWAVVNAASEQWVAETVRNPNLLSNHNFLTPSPDDITHPSATPTDYVAGTQIFSGVFVESDVVGFTYINGRVKWTNPTGAIYLSVPNIAGLEYVTTFTASVADFDGKPRTRGVSFALVGDEYRVTVGVDALEDESANATLLGSVKFEQGVVATGHEVIKNDIDFVDVRAPTYLSTISQAQMGGELPLSVFLPKNREILSGIYNYTSSEDLSEYVRDAVEAFDNRGTIIVPSGLYNMNQIDVEEKALQFVSSGHMATVFQLNGGDYLWKQINCSRKTTGQSQFWVKEQANGAGLSGIIFSGNSRAFDGSSGLVYEGLNDDVLLSSVDFYGFKGVALDMGDPNSTTTGEQALRESFFNRTHIKNCGTGALPAMRIGRCATAIEDSHNNLHFENLSLVYSYGFSLDIVNERLGGYNNAMRKLTFKNAFIHGNKLLPSTDYNGESTSTQTGSLVRIGGGDGFITDCKFTDSFVVDNEDGKIGVNVLDRASVEWDGGNPGGGNNRTGIRYKDARQGAVRNLNTDDGVSMTNVLDVESMAGNSKVTIEGWSFLSDGSTPSNTVTPLTNLRYINDLNLQFLTYELAEQLTASDEIGGTPLRIIEKDCNIVKATITVNDAVLGNDTDYASIVLRVFDESGVLVDAATTTTQNTGGTGNITAKTSAILNLPNTTLLRPLWSLQISISKGGSGVILPASTITVEISPNITR